MKRSSTRDYVAHIESRGIPVFNGTRAFGIETSKALQVSLLERLRLPVPRTRVVNHPRSAARVAGASVPSRRQAQRRRKRRGIIRFDDLSSCRCGRRGRARLRPDGTILLQEYHAPRHASIVRVETLLGATSTVFAFTWATGRDSTRPADVQDRRRRGSGQRRLPGRRGQGRTDGRGVHACARDRPASRADRGAADIDVGGIEYLESARDGRLYFYDINALSNFVADPVRVVGFDPTARLVDALTARARIEDAEAPAAAAGGRGL